MPIFDPQMFDDNQSTNEDFEPIKPGEYPFVVDEAVSRTKEKGNEYRSGNEGIALTLLVGAKEDRDVPVYTHLVNTPKAAWKIKEFCECVGMDPKNIESARQFVNLGGRAEFVNNEKGYLTAEKFLPAEKKAEEDNVPF